MCACLGLQIQKSIATGVVKSRCQQGTDSDDDLTPPFSPTYSSDDDDLEEEKDCNLLTQWTWPAKEASCQLAQWLDLLWTWPAKKDALLQTTGG